MVHYHHQQQQELSMNTPAGSGESEGFRIGGTTVVFEENWKTGIGGGLWSTGLSMAQYLQEHPKHALTQLSNLQTRICRSEKNRRKLKILELGSGNGFLATCWWALLAEDPSLVDEIVVTDTKDHCKLIEQTIGTNHHLQEKTDIKVRVCEHKWGIFHPPLSNQTFDLIVGSDLAYREELYDPLIASLIHFCHKDTHVLLGVTMNDTKPEFFRMLRRQGFDYM